GAAPPAVPWGVIPPGSLVKAWSAAARRPSTSMMSSDGAPRAKEIEPAMALRLRGWLEEVHVDDGTVGALVLAHRRAAHLGQRLQRRRKAPQRLGAVKWARRHARHRPGSGRGLTTVGQLAGGGQQALLSLHQHGEPRHEV